MRGRTVAGRVLAVAAAVALAAGASGCSAAGKPPVVPSDEGVEPAAVVRVVDNAYSPERVEIEVGQAVRWVFEGSQEHDVVADDGGFVSELVTDGTYTRVFEEAGEFGYDCSIHPEMRGVVVVTE